MSANSFGTRFVVTTFGESHGVGLGAIIDGCPAGVPFDEEFLCHQLKRRRPGRRDQNSALVSERHEADQPEVFSGVHNGLTLGTPIAIIVRNQDHRPSDYDEIVKVPRPGHADDVWRGKFGHSDHRGGGRSSGRETVARVMAGAVAQMVLRALSPSLHITGFVRQIGPIGLSDEECGQVSQILDEGHTIDEFLARFPSHKMSSEIEHLLSRAKEDGLSHGGVAELWIDGSPPFLGQPVFHKLKADLAAAFLGIGATSAIEVGAGWLGSQSEGSRFHGLKSGEGERRQYGGIRGGLSTGERIVVRVGFKPPASIMKTARAGRHDPCVVPRVVPVLEAMAAMVLVDHILWRRTDQIG